MGHEHQAGEGHDHENGQQFRVSVLAGMLTVIARTPGNHNKWRLRAVLVPTTLFMAA